MVLSVGISSPAVFGEILAVAPKNEGTRGNIRMVTGGSPTEPPVDNTTPTLTEIGITKKQSSRAQKLAEVPEEKFEEILKEAPKNEGMKGQLKGKSSSGGSLKEPPEDKTPTLAEEGELLAVPDGNRQ